MSQAKSSKAREILAKNVRYYRELRGLSCEELSLAIGHDNSYISKIENSNMNLTIDVLDLIAEQLFVDVKNLFQ